MIYWKNEQYVKSFNNILKEWLTYLVLVKLLGSYKYLIELELSW